MREKRFFIKNVCLLLLLSLCVGVIGSGEMSTPLASSRPKKVKIVLLKRYKKSVIFKIKKKGKTSGYQIFLKAGKKGKYHRLTGTKKSIVKIKNLKKNKVYYIKVRGYRVSGHSIIRGAYSSRLKVPKYEKAKKKKKTTATAKPTKTTNPTKKPTSTPKPTATKTPESTAAPATETAVSDAVSGSAA